MEYLVFLKNYESLYVIKTKAYNEEVKEALEWLYGHYTTILVLENPKINFVDTYVIETKKEVLEEIEWKKESFFFDEEGKSWNLKLDMLKTF